MGPASQLGFAALVLDALPDATVVLDQTGTIVAVNNTWLRFAVDNGGDPDATGLGVNYLELCARSAAAGCEDAAVVAGGIRSVLASSAMHTELEYPCPSPAAGRWFLLRINPIATPARGAVLCHVNITRRKIGERDLAHEAAHDPLTGLANRRLFTTKLAAALTPRHGRSTQVHVGVLYLDLDSFKPVNDTYGHDAGDEVLMLTAHRLHEQVRPQDTVARLGGDEFAIIAPRINAGGLSSLAARITDALGKPHLIHGEFVTVPVSVGAHLASPGDTAEHAIRSADAAMYTVKRPNRR